ncbi:MAG: cysteine--tRNA ligase, partial [Flavobacteriaceae bacterium]|nr:cysteine--tRNA ligase [Flavobacteriaceae bacterium]
SNSSSFDVSNWRQQWYDALNDDFNSPILIANLFDVVKFINQLKENKATITAEDLKLLSETLKDFVFDVLGLVDEADNNSQTEKLEGTIELLIQLRAEAKANKDYALSDQIRNQLLDLGIQLKDGREGTSYNLN